MVSGDIPAQDKGGKDLWDALRVMDAGLMDKLRAVTNLEAALVDLPEAGAEWLQLIRPTEDQEAMLRQNPDLTFDRATGRLRYPSGHPVGANDTGTYDPGAKLLNDPYYNVPKQYEIPVDIKLLPEDGDRRDGLVFVDTAYHQGWFPEDRVPGLQTPPRDIESEDTDKLNSPIVYRHTPDKYSEKDLNTERYANQHHIKLESPEDQYRNEETHHRYPVEPPETNFELMEIRTHNYVSPPDSPRTPPVVE